jgi:TolB protein
MVSLAAFMCATALPHTASAQTAVATGEPTSTPLPTQTPEFGGGAGQILYATKVDNGSEIFSNNLQDTNRVQLTSSRNPKLFPSWSPDGTQILYEEIVASINAVYVKDASLDAVPRDLVHGTYPRWTPDGKRIILTIDGGGTSIYVRNVDGSGVPQVVVAARNAKDPVTNPSMGGPGGTLIAYITRRGTAGTFEIYITKISDTLGSISKNNINDRYPVWSPDGSKIAYSNDNGEICVIEVSGITFTVTGNTCLPKYIASNSCPSWSPDGTHIAFVSKLKSEAEYRYFVMAADGTAVRPLTRDPAYVYVQPNGFIRCSPVSWK